MVAKSEAILVQAISCSNSSFCVRELSSQFLLLRFASRMSRLTGRQGWSSVPILDGWVQLIRGPRPIREVPQFQPAALFQQSKVVPVEAGEFSWCRHESPQLAALGAEEMSVRAELQAALQRAKGSVTAFGTILPKSRHHHGGSSVEGVQVGAGFGRIGGHQWSRGRCNQEGPRER